MTNPLVSVLLPVYNGERYIKTSLSSILNQTYKNLEIVVVNDSCTDGSIKIIKSFNDKRVAIRNNEKNLGQTKSLNIGLGVARGKYIARMDADDVGFPLWIEKLVYFMEKHPEYAVVGPGAVVINGDGRIENVIFSPDNYDAIMFRIFFETPLNHVGSLMKRETIMSLGGFNESFLVAQDFELWSSIIRNNGKITSIPDLLVGIRLHEESVTAMASNNRSIYEPAQTIYENIRCLTNLIITYEDAVNLRKMFKKPCSLSLNEFCQTIEIFTGIYNNLKYNINREKFRKYMRSQIVKVYCKRALQEIDFRRIHEGKRTSWQFLMEWGFHIMPFIIYVSSFLGRRAVHWLSKIYKKYLQIRAHLYYYRGNKIFCI